MMKTLTKLKMDKKLSQLDKKSSAKCGQLTSSLTDGNKCKDICSHLSSVTYLANDTQRNRTGKGNKRHTDWKRKKEIVPICSGHVSLCRKD